MSASRSARRSPPLLAAALAAAALLGPDPASAAKPDGGGGGGSTPSPTGSVFFQTWAPFSTDPSGGTKAGPFPGGDPSNSVHGGGRWFVGLKEYPEVYQAFSGSTGNTGTWPRVEVVAVKADPLTGAVLDTVPLTNLFQPSLVEGSKALIPTQVRWSNANDGFVSFLVNEYTADARGWLDSTTWRPGLYRLNVSGPMVAAGVAPAGPAGVAAVFDDLRLYGGGVSGWDWTKTANLAAPGGERLAWTQTSAATGREELRVLEPTGAVATVVSGPQYSAVGPRWCPDPAKADLIVYAGNVPAKSLILRGVWTVTAAAGATPRSVIESTGTNYYSQPEWSPAGGHLALRHVVDRIEADEYDVLRVDAGGRNKSSLTADLPKNQGKSVLRWTN